MQFKGTGALFVKDLDVKRGIIQAYWNASGNKDDQGDIAEPGCWTRSIKERGPASRQPRIKYLYQHNETMLLGKPSELLEDSFGLLATCQIVPTTLGKDCLLLYEAGVISEHSVGYETIQSQWDTKTGARRLIECQLWEGSAVTWGANSATPVVAIKSLTQPERLQEIATKAARLDNLLHNGTLRSDALCETLERELKALQTALAPTADAASQPYTIQGVLDAMDDLTARLSTKAASDDDKKAQEARAKKYGIGVKDGGNVTKPGKWTDLSDADFGDPVNYNYPMPDKAHADDAAGRFGAETARAQYTAKEQDIIAKRIMAKQTSYGEKPDWWPPADDSNKGADVNTRMVKGSGGTVAVSEDGTHAAYTGTHVHGHKAFDSQGGDDTHEHKHSHEDDAKHDHSHDAKAATSVQRPMRKAVDFATALQQVSADDTLQDEWGDAFQALVNALSSVMVNACYGMGAVADSSFDPQDAAETILSQFSDAMADLVKRSLAADFCPMLDDDGDSFYDPDGPNADEDDYKARNPLAMPDAPAPLRKAGRAISGANRETITTALDGMTKAMGDMQMHHAAIADLMTKTDPDAVRQDEADTQGDDDSENGGTNINKSRHPDTPRRTAIAERTSQASTTHDGDSDTSDTTALLADLDSVVSRLKSTAAAGKASK